MFRSLWRLAIGRAGRTFVALVLIATAWAVWWVQPPRPIRQVRLAGVGIGELSDDGASLTLSQLSEYGQFLGGFLLHLDDGTVYEPERQGKGFFSCLSPSGERALYIEARDVVVRETRTGSELSRTPLPKAIEKERDWRQRTWEFKRKLLWRFTSLENRIAIVSDGIDVYETTSGRHVVHVNAIPPFGLSADGTLLANLDGHERSTVVVTALDSGQIVGRLVLPTGKGAYGLSFNSHGTQIAACGMDYGLVVWDWPMGAVVAHLPSVEIESLEWDFSSSGRLLIGGHGREIIDLEAKPLTVFQLPLPIPGRSLVEMSKDGSRYVVTDEESNWTIFDTATRNSLAQGKARYADFLRLSPDGRWLIVREMGMPSRGFLGWFRRTLGFLKSPDWQNRFIDTENGATVLTLEDIHPNREPVGSDFLRRDFTRFMRNCNVVGIHPRTATAWTMRFAENDDTIFEQWRLSPRRPGWWLWLLTGGGFVVVIGDWHWSRRRSRLSRGQIASTCFVVQPGPLPDAGTGISSSATM